MNPTATQVEVDLETSRTQAEEATLEALKELSSIELAYVGGGMATPSWF